MSVTNVSRLQSFLTHTRFMANLTAALDSKTNIALIVGYIDDTTTIRDMFGVVSCDVPLQVIATLLQERFGGHHSLRAQDVFLILLTGDEAAKAGEIAESTRATVETMSLDERFKVTMHFGVSRASSHWTSANGFQELFDAAEDAIRLGQRKVVANRVYLAP